MKEKKYLRALSESAVLIALSVCLSFIILFKLPLGGSVTMASMLPICIISIRHGYKWGFVSSFIYSLFQLAISLVSDNGILAWSLTPIMLFGCIMLDYIIPFTALGISGLFRDKGVKGMYFGISIAFFIRLLSHILSGVIIFSYFDQFELFKQVFYGKPLLYSIAYNLTFMFPELLITFIILTIMIKIPYIKNNLIKK